MAILLCSLFFSPTRQLSTILIQTQILGQMEFTGMYRSKSKPFGPGILAEMIQHAALEPVPGAGFPARQVWCMPRQTEDPIRIQSIQLPSDNSRKYRACNLFKSLPDSSGLEGLLYNLRKVASGYLYNPPAICCGDSTESTEYINFWSSALISWGDFMFPVLTPP